MKKQTIEMIQSVGRGIRHRKVKLKNPRSSHEGCERIVNSDGITIMKGKKAVKVGTEGKVIAVRKGGDELLVKFKGHRSPRHTSSEDVEFINTVIKVKSQ